MQLNLTSKLIIGSVITLAIALCVSFFIIAQREEKLILSQLENKARVLFKQIVIMRQWIADHGGVFIQRLPWEKPSPFLDDPEIVDVSGKRYLKKTPAMVTKELSKYSRDKELYWFKITSNKLTNPENAPDEFEQKALMLFQNNELNEMLSVETINKSNYMRYIAPLYVEPACLSCHSKQGYKAGEVRGAISITIPMDNTLAEIQKSRRNMAIAGILTTILLSIALYVMMRKIVTSPIKQLKSSITDFANGKYSDIKEIKTGDEFEDICITFKKMALTIMQYQDELNEKIYQATKDIRDANDKLQEANKLLQDNNARKSDFIARASHELRTPLTSIKGSMDYISAKLSDHNLDYASTCVELQRFFDLIKKNTDRLIRMVNTMLDIERIELGVLDWNVQDVDLTELVAETVFALEISAIEKNIDIVFKPNSKIFVSADADRIRQTLINLLSNAIKFTPSNSYIQVDVSIEGTNVVCEISDNAEVISEDDYDKIFIKFYKKDPSGSGLGLAIAKSIVEAHKGKIGVKKSANTSGNCFYFTLMRQQSL